MRSRKGSEVRSNRKSAILGTLAGWWMKLLAATLRIEVRDECGIGSREARIPPVIYVLWHNRILIVPPVWQRLCGRHRKTVTLASASHDGDIVARAMAFFGMGSVRGSSSRRGVAALVGLKRALADGMDVCLTPDGPRGPRYVMQPGAVKLAQSSGTPVVPVHVRFSSAWRLKTWDRFVVPKPFSKVTVVFAEPLRIARELDEAGFEAERMRLERILLDGADDV